VTLVVPRAAGVLAVLTGGADSVAVRMPDHPTALALIEAVGAPLAVTSANLSGAPETTTAEEVYAALGERLALILDAGRCPGGVASTIIDTTRDPPVILRRGARVEEVERLLKQGL
jgi:L-threonylcarbamoyladenylate synthase